MSELYFFISRHKNILILIALEVLSWRWMVTRNEKWNSSFLNTSNYYAAGILSISNSLGKYLGLAEVNQKLAEENAVLREELYAKKLGTALSEANQYPSPHKYASRYSFVAAKVIDSQTSQANNYITIDKGTDDGLEVGMGVISADGIVGKVKYSSKKISVVTSILHTQFTVSTELAKNGEIGSVKWSGADPEEAQMLDMSRTDGVQLGDSVITSHYNSVFPPGVMVGTVSEFTPRAGSTAPDLRLKLATDFKKLVYVYVVKDAIRQELDEVQKTLSPKKK